MDDKPISSAKLIERLALEEYRLKGLGSYAEATGVRRSIQLAQELADPPPAPSLDTSEAAP